MPLSTLNFTVFKQTTKEEFIREEQAVKYQQGFSTVATQPVKIDQEVFKTTTELKYYFPELVELDTQSVQQFSIGLKVYYPKFQTHWFLQVKVEPQQKFRVEMVVSDKMLAFGMHVVRTVATLLGSFN